MTGAVDSYVERGDIFVERLARTAATSSEVAAARQLRIVVDAFECEQHGDVTPLISVGLDRQELFCGLCESAARREAG